MTFNTFLEKAISGGFVMSPKYTYFDGKSYSSPCIEKIIFSPLAWEAVGKVEGWNDCPEQCIKCENKKGYKKKMHQMIDHLIEEGTIESYLATL